MAYHIIEIANTHGGDINYLKSLIKEFEEFREGFGMKLQVLKSDEIATKDYEWYDVYEELFFNPEQWKEIIEEVKKTKDVWIDVFDKYSISVIGENLKDIYGLKFQASVLNNFLLFREMGKLDLSDKIVMLNVAGYEIEQIKEIIHRVSTDLNPKEIILQVGFQAYPTELADSGISKIKTIKENFQNKVAFADHTDGKSEESIYLPIIAEIAGADIIEKHVMHSKLETKYDYFSSLNLEMFSKYLKLREKYISALNAEFVKEKERYFQLKKDVQIPILNRDLRAGQIPSLKEDFDFRRSSKKGLSVYEIRDLLAGMHVLNKDKKSGEPLKSEDFKKANIATIIACRMKSTRLPKKAILKIGNISSVELCIKNALKFKNVSHTILATSDVQEDDVLRNYTYHDSVIFHKGDPDDVIKRYLGIIDKLKIDLVVRVTADMQYVSSDILQILLKSHFENGADYTIGKEAAVGTNLEIINSAALKKIKQYFPSANYSEYMTFYFKNNPAYFRLNYVGLPKEFVRDYRLTLDYKEDLDMFNEIEKYFTENKIEYNIKELFDFLDKNPKVANINKHINLTYKTDQNLIGTLNKATTIVDKDIK